MTVPITVASRWETRDGVDGLAPRRRVTVVKVVAGKHNIDKGPTYPPPDDDVHFTLDDLDGEATVCGVTAFRRTYVPLRARADD